jgi:hypothetical protein
MKRLIFLWLEGLILFVVDRIGFSCGLGGLASLVAERVRLFFGLGGSFMAWEVDSLCGWEGWFLL